MGVNSRPPFFMPLFRTSVRYKGSRCDCVRVAYSINRHRFILLTAHSSLRPRCPLLLSPRFLSSYVRPVRLACRLVEHLVMRLVSCVLLCRIRLSCRLTCSSRRFISLVVSYGRRSALLFARSRFACRGGLALRSRAVSFLPWHFVCHLVSSAVSSAHLVRRFVRFHPWVSRIRSRAWFSCSRRSVLLFARSCSPIRHRFMFLVVGRGCASWPWGGRGLFSSHPSHHHACSLLTHSLRDGSMGGCGIWGAVSCCSPLVPCPLMPHRSPHHVGSPSSSLRSLIPSSTKQESRGRKRRRRGNRTGTMKTRRIETRRLTRWIKRDARQDEDGTETIRRTSKQRDAWTRRGNETGNETTSDKKRKTNNDGDWLMSFLLASTQHERRRDDEGNTFSSFRPTPSPQALSHPPASINPPPPGRGMSKQEDDLPCRRHEMMSGRERFGCAALSLIDRSLFPSHPFPVSSPPHIPRRFRKLILPCRL